MALLCLGALCMAGTHPALDGCHKAGRNAALRSWIQKALAVSITVLCACILNWSSFVFAAVYEHQVERYPASREHEPIAQSNLGTGMLAVNAAMLLAIILSVIHCGAPVRADVDGTQEHEHENENEDAGGDADESARAARLTRQQRRLLRRVPGNSNAALLANPERWFKAGGRTSLQSGGVEEEEEVEVDELKEFEYQNMSVVGNLSMKRIRTAHETEEKGAKSASLLDGGGGDGDSLEVGVSSSGLCRVIDVDSGQQQDTE